MFRSPAAAAALRMLRLVAASSRPAALYYRPIVAAPVNPVRHFAIFDPVARFPADQSRGYARGRPAVSSEDDDDDEDDEELDEFDDEECMDSEDFDDEDDDGDNSE